MTPELTSHAKQLYEHLKAAYEKGTVTPKSPITSKRMVNVYNAKPFEWGLDAGGEQIREMVSWLNVNKMAICSGTQGYFYSDNPEDVRATAAHLTSRARALEERARQMLELAGDIEKRRNDIFEHPVVETLKEDFGAKQMEPT